MAMRRRSRSVAPMLIHFRREPPPFPPTNAKRAWAAWERIAFRTVCGKPMYGSMWGMCMGPANEVTCKRCKAHLAKLRKQKKTKTAQRRKTKTKEKR